MLTSYFMRLLFSFLNKNTLKRIKMQQSFEIIRKSYLSGAKKIVLKLGTRILLEHHRNEDKSHIEKLVADIVEFHKKGYEFSIVTSGAVGFGMDQVGLKTRPNNLKNIQALASIGQSLLMRKWHNLFEKYGLHVGQILLTYDIIENRQRYLHARDCFKSVLDYQAIPIVNENDSVAIDELKFGDNDTLSALTAILMDADLLVLFSDIEGLFTKNPQIYPDAERISFVKRITNETFALIDDKKNDFSIGGMTSKLLAAQRAVQMGTGVIITDGRRPNLSGILEGRDIGTFFNPRERNSRKRKRWIFSHHRVKGKIFIDVGAENALVRNSRSLLPGGIVRVEKEFNEGEIVGIFSQENVMIGKGITYYSSEDIEKIKGQRTNEINKAEVKRYYDEVIHRDNLIIL